jgi:dienelactone hydrolase
VKRLFDDDGFEFERLNLLGAAYRGLTDIGEVLVTLDGIEDGDRESWVGGFTALGDRLRLQAEESARDGHRHSARSAYLRAAAYYATASSNAPGTSDPDRFTRFWEQHRACWDLAAAEFDPPIEPVAIPYEDTELAGYFFHARSPHGERAASDPRPTVVLNNGSDGPVTDMWLFGGAAAVERGWNAVTFDGPGQGAALHRQKLSFRADWEQVVTPVVDWLLTRTEVDPDRVVLHGVSQAGYWVPRAIAYEHRIAAAVADPGVMRVSDSWRANLPDAMSDLIAKGDKKEFDELMEAGLKEAPAQREILRWRMAPYGTDSYFDAYVAADQMSLDADTLGRISCPLLITSPDHEQFWPGQSEELHQAVPGSTLVTFTEAEGADWHCEPAAHGLRDERVFDWLEETLGIAG